jgi:hypothetical protein
MSRPRAPRRRVVAVVVIRRQPRHPWPGALAAEETSCGFAYRGDSARRERRANRRTSSWKRRRRRRSPSAAGNHRDGPRRGSSENAYPYYLTPADGSGASYAYGGTVAWPPEAHAPRWSDISPTNESLSRTRPPRRPSSTATNQAAVGPPLRRQVGPPVLEPTERSPVGGEDLRGHVAAEPARCCGRERSTEADTPRASRLLVDG